MFDLNRFVEIVFDQLSGMDLEASQAEEEPDAVSIKGAFGVDGYDNNIYISIYALDSGTLYLDFYFEDDIKENIDTLALINDFNRKNTLFKAFIDEDKLILSFTTLPIAKTSEDLYLVVKTCINSICKEELMDTVNMILKA